MEVIDPIYRNNVGYGFYWKDSGRILSDRVQIIFRDTGFYFSKIEITEFYNRAVDIKTNSNCFSCPTRACCRSLLLRTPVKSIDLAINIYELEGIKDLLAGILFHIDLKEYVGGLGLN